METILSKFKEMEERDKGGTIDQGEPNDFL